MDEGERLPMNNFNRSKNFRLKLIALKDKYIGYFFAALFLIVAGIVMLYAFDESLSRRTEVTGKVVSAWYKEGTWDPNRNVMTQDNYFIRAATEAGTFDFNVFQSQYSEFQPGEKVKCVIGVGFFRQYPIEIGKAR
jgi:hypothetical protein